MLPLASIEGDVPTGLGQPVLAKGIALSKSIMLPSTTT
jgi:hypothetical protein